MSILLMPTDIEDNDYLNKLDFVNWAQVAGADATKWSKAFAGKLLWYSALQDEFEAACEAYWIARNTEPGYFPGARIKEAHFAKMLEPKLPGSDDMRASNSALAALESAREAHKAQIRKVTMCKAQLEQSEDKLESIAKRLANAEARWEAFKDTAFYGSTDF